ncbi:hypothetical protein [Streptomyces sp. enrichment culture]|uniref:hypothetical protein n=1 Tax=Streptomyces sp. enrichment culture TaxID=1795815 RepID=UPI003F57E21A
MRRSATVLGSLAAAALLAVTVPVSAHAANGTLVIDDRTIHNPHGCYNNDQDAGITNNTNRTAKLYEDDDCKGAVAETVEPGQETIADRTNSVRID